MHSEGQADQGQTSPLEIGRGKIIDLLLILMLFNSTSARIGHFSAKMVRHISVNKIHPLFDISFALAKNGWQKAVVII